MRSYQTKTDYLNTKIDKVKKCIVSHQGPLHFLSVSRKTYITIRKIGLSKAVTVCI